MTFDLNSGARRREAACLSDLQLDRLRLGELFGTPEESLARVHLSKCDACAARLRELEAESTELPKLTVLAPALPRPLWARPRWQAGAAMVAMAAAAAVFLLPRQASEDVASVTRFKGGDALGLFVRRAAAAGTGSVEGPTTERVTPGDVLHPGDAIRFELATRAASHVVVVGLDAKNQVTAYYPTGNNAKPVAAGQGILLPGSTILDDTLGAERLFAILCPGPLAVAQVVEAGQAAVKAHPGHPEQIDQLDLGCRQTSFLIEKAAK